MQIVTRTEINQMLRRLQGSRSLRKWAESIDLSAAYLSDVLRGNRGPGPKLLKILKLRRTKTSTITYERIK